MSKFKINDHVIVKETNTNGIIKGRDVKDIGNGRVKVEYIVKTGEGFENWGSYTKDQLGKINSHSNRKVIPTLILEASNGYKVTLVAIIANRKYYAAEYDKNNNISTYPRKGKDLRIGYAIYNPSDKYDTDFGQRIAIHRARRSPFCHLFSNFSGEFNKETVDALLKVKGDYIVNNIEFFIDRK